MKLHHDASDVLPGDCRAVAARRSSWLIPVSLIILSVAGVGIGSMAPVPGQAVAAIFPPWWSASRAFAAAAGAHAAIVRRGAWPGLIVAARSGPGLAARLHAAGAWLTLNPQALGGCGIAAPPR